MPDVLLVRCASCHRHARDTEARCPFCAGPLEPPPPRARPPRRPLTRALLFYGATTLAGACAEPPADPPPPPALAPVALEPSTLDPSVSAPVMQPTAVAPADELSTGPVVVAPPVESEAERRAEQAHAEAAKPPRTRRRITTQAVGNAGDRDRVGPPDWVDDRMMMPYGAPPADFDPIV